MAIYERREVTTVLTPAELAWQRDNVWPTWMRKLHTENPGYLTHCACEWGMTAFCEWGKCGQCQGSARDYSPLTTIAGKRGYVTGFHTPYEHHEVKPDGSYGPHTDAAVWPVGTSCRWRCSHACHTGQLAGVPRAVTMRPAEDALFEVVV